MRIKVLRDTVNNKSWNVRLVNEGERYGLKGCLKHDSSDPLVEFHDPLWAHTPLGQFVSRYLLSTLLKKSSGGILLDTGHPSWTLSEPALISLLAWLKAAQPEQVTGNAETTWTL